MINNTDLLTSKRTLLNAVKLLSENGHDKLAEAVWRAAISPKRVLLTGEPER